MADGARRFSSEAEAHGSGADANEFSGTSSSPRSVNPPPSLAFSHRYNFICVLGVAFAEWKLRSLSLSPQLPPVSCRPGTTFLSLPRLYLSLFMWSGARQCRPHSLHRSPLSLPPPPEVRSFASLLSASHLSSLLRAMDIFHARIS